MYQHQQNYVHIAEPREEAIIDLSNKNNTERQCLRVDPGNEYCESIKVTCYHCRRHVDTVIEHHPGSGTYYCSILLCLFTGILCCWLPFCKKNCNDVHHYCSKCRTSLGVYRYYPCSS